MSKGIRHRLGTPMIRGEPIVRRLLAEMNVQRVSYFQMAKRVGLHERTIKNWRQGLSGPSAGNLEACFNVLGLTLTVKEIEHD